jgi:peptide-O-fucosyltransferase
MDRTLFFYLLINALIYIFSDAIQADQLDDEIAFETTSKHGLNVGIAKHNNTGRRYLIYDVNPGEGFNLRRDVYLRVANLMKLLLEDQNWVLVLPPWRRLYHWRSPIHQTGLPWRTFFDLKNLNYYVPVMDFEDFVKEIGGHGIDEIIHLQRYAEGWKDGVWEEKIDDRPCIDNPVYHKGDDGLYRGYFWDMPEVFARKFKCISAQGTSSILKAILEKSQSR